MASETTGPHFTRRPLLLRRRDGQNRLIPWVSLISVIGAGTPDAVQIGYKRRHRGDEYRFAAIVVHAFSQLLSSTFSVSRTIYQTKQL